MPVADLGVLLSCLRQVEHDVEIGVDHFFDARSLDLDDHLLAGEQSGGIDLGERCGCDRLGIDGSEDLGDRLAQLELDHGSGFFPGDGRNAILEVDQLFDKLRREQV